MIVSSWIDGVLSLGLFQVLEDERRTWGGCRVTQSSKNNSRYFLFPMRPASCVLRPPQHEDAWGACASSPLSRASSLDPSKRDVANDAIDIARTSREKQPALGINESIADEVTCTTHHRSLLLHPPISSKILHSY